MRKAIITSILGMLFLSSFGQQGDYFLSIKQYPFIKYSDNKISFPSKGNGFEDLYQKLDSIILLGEGKLNIVHIGGSHIQADIYTHQIRKHLQSLQYDLKGARGLIFPFTIAKTNNPWNYKVRYTGNWSFCKNTQYKRTCTLGLTGMSITTSSPKASISIDINSDSTTNYTFSQVKIYHSPSNYLLKIPIGDSAYTGHYNYDGGYTTIEVPLSNKLYLELQNTDTIADDITLYGLLLDNNDPGIVYHSIGVNGAKLESFNYCELYAEQLKSLNPDLVIFSIGTNDGNTKHFNAQKYHDEYVQLINKTKQAAPNADILITVPNDVYYYKRYVNENTPLLRKEIYSIAKKYNYGVWDFFDIMGGLNSSQTWYNYGLMKYDRIHFNAQGYYLKGDLFVTAFLRSWEKNLSYRYNQHFQNEHLSNYVNPSQLISE
jgi:lysophospholipase L1-like esterase